MWALLTSIDPLCRCNYLLWKTLGIWHVSVYCSEGDTFEAVTDRCDHRDCKVKEESDKDDPLLKLFGRRQEPENKEHYRGAYEEVGDEYDDPINVFPKYCQLYRCAFMWLGHVTISKIEHIGHPSGTNGGDQAHLRQRAYH